LRLLQEIRKASATTKVVMISAYSSIPAVKRAFELGAFDFLDKSDMVTVSDIDHFRDLVRRALHDTDTQLGAASVSGRTQDSASKTTAAQAQRRGTRGKGRQISYPKGSVEEDSGEDEKAEQADGEPESTDISGEERLLSAIFGERIDVPQPLSTEKREELARVFDTLFDPLQANEREVLKHRFGLGPREGSVSTLQEVAELLGVTRDRVRMIEASALRRLRQPIRSEQLLPYYGLLYPKADQVG
jgi:RNA polymerase sigma factor (sigma-70 family)